MTTTGGGPAGVAQTGRGRERDREIEREREWKGHNLNNACAATKSEVGGHCVAESYL